MDSVGGWAVGSCPSATSTFRKALVGYTVGVWWYVAICCQGNGSYYNIYVEPVPPANGSATADNDFEVTKPLKVWKHLGEIEIYVHFAESHQHEHNEHMTWKHKKFTCLLERLKNDFEILRTSTFNWSKDSVTFEKVDFPTSALRLISINSHLALSEKLFLQSPLWDLNCGGLDFFQAVNWKSSSKPCWLKSKLDSRRVTNIEHIVIYQLCSSKFIPKNRRRKKELSRSGSIFRKNKERKKEYGKLQHPQPTASLHLRAHRLGNACQVLAHWEEPEEIDPPQN